MDSRDFKAKIVKIFTAFAASVVFILGFNQIAAITDILFSAFAPFIMGGIFAVILNIPVRFIETKILKKSPKKLNKIKRPLSIFLSLLLLIGIITGISIIIGPEIAKAISEMSKSIPNAIQEGVVFLKNNFDIKNEWLTELHNIETASKSWNSLINYATKLTPHIAPQLNNIMSVIKNIFGSITSLLISTVFCIYIVAEKEKIITFCKDFTKTFINTEKSKKISKFLKTLHISFEDFIYGQCLECFLVATIFTIVASIMGFKCAIIVGIAMFFLAFIPYIGNFIACGLGALLTLAMETPSRAIIICVLFCIIQLLDQYLLYPRVIGIKVKMPPLLIFVSVIIGGNLFGLIGMFVSIPIVTTFYLLIKEEIKKKEIVKQTVD